MAYTGSHDGRFSPAALLGAWAGAFATGRGLTGSGSPHFPQTGAPVQPSFSRFFAPHSKHRTISPSVPAMSAGPQTSTPDVEIQT